MRYLLMKYKIEWMEIKKDRGLEKSEGSRLKSCKKVLKFGWFYGMIKHNVGKGVNGREQKG